MKLSALIATLVLTGAAATTQAHANKCQHTHDASGAINWEENCGGGAALWADAGPLAHGDAASHPPNNMLLFGSDEIFASHIVYKVPHNFQVILRVKLPEAAKRHYLFLKESEPDAQIVLLLDPSDIGMIESAATIRGTIKKRGSSNRILSPHVTLTRDEFEVVYFNQLPLDLGGELH